MPRPCNRHTWEYGFKPVELWSTLYFFFSSLGSGSMEVSNWTRLTFVAPAVCYGVHQLVSLRLNSLTHNSCSYHNLRRLQIAMALRFHLLVSQLLFVAPIHSIIPRPTLLTKWHGVESRLLWWWLNKICTFCRGSSPYNERSRSQFKGPSSIFVRGTVEVEDNGRVTLNGSGKEALLARLSRRKSIVRQPRTTPLYFWQYLSSELPRGY